MNDKIFMPQPVIPVQPRQQAVKSSHTKPQPDFKQLLDGELQKTRLKFSQHAQQRLTSRKINLSPKDMANLESAVAKAAAKGAKESLILMNQVALIVSIPNKTVITAVDGQSLKENVFTNIDSAVII